MALSLKWSIHRITTKFEFKISRSAESYYDVVIIELSDGKHIAFGEAAPSTRYESGPAGVITLLETYQAQILDLPIDDGESRQDQLERLFPTSFALQAALDTAFWDLHGQLMRQPLWQMFGAEKKMVTSSYTIGISDLSVIPEKITEAHIYPLLKIKLGTDYDHDIMRAIRKETDKVLRVDVNEGWKTLDDAKRGVEWLVEENVEFLEQPMPARQLTILRGCESFLHSPWWLMRTQSGQKISLVWRTFMMASISS